MQALARTAFVTLVALGFGAPPAAAQDSSSGLSGFATANGDAQPRHDSPIRRFDAHKGGGLDGARMPGMGPRPVTPFLTRGVQHRDSRPAPVMPLAGFDRAPGDMPYRTDNIRLPEGELGELRRNADAIKGAVGYSGPGDTVDGYGQATLRTADGYIRAFGRAVRAGDAFEDGDGDDVPFAYRRNSQQLILGLTPGANTEIFGVLVRDEIDDDRTPSSGLDNVETDRIVGRVGFEQRDGFGLVDRVRGEVRVRAAGRKNNNYEVRDFTVQPGARRVEVENERRIIDGRLFADTSTGPVAHRIGLDWRFETRDGNRVVDTVPGNATPNLDTLGARLFPDAAMTEVGPTWEGAWSPGEDDHLRAGLGYRYVHAEARDADTPGDGVPFGLLAPGLPSTARNAYNLYYGVTDVDHTDHLLHAKLLYQREFLNDRLTLFGEVGRSDRAPDSKERFWAGTTPLAAAANRTIGNPELNPERRYEAGLGFQLDGADWMSFGRARRTGETLLTGAWSVSGAVRGAYVDDFITRDRARGQEGVLQNDGALVFRNVNAALTTAEIDASWNVTPNLSTRANLIYSWGENLSDDRALYGVAPGEINLLVDWSDRLGSIGTWSVGGKLRLVADQDRVDADTATGAGFDEGVTAGFTVLDLYAGAQIYDRVGLRVGVENLLDEAYQEHVARDTLDFSQARARVNAPGRTFFVRGAASF